MAEFAAVVLGVLLIAVVVVGLRHLWLPQGPLAGSDLVRFGVIPDDGMATRSQIRYPDGEAQISANARRLTVGQMSVEWPIEARVGLFALGVDSTSGAAPAANGYSAVEILTTTSIDGQQPTRRRTFVAISPDGVYLLALTLDASPTVHAFDPPLLLRPRHLPVGASWESQGSFGLGGQYRFTAQVGAPGTVGGPLGTFDDCLPITERLELRQGSDSLDGAEEVAHICPGVGEVARRSPSTGTETELLATTRLPDVASAVAVGEPGPPTVVAGPGGSPHEWELSLVGSVAGSRSSSAPTFRPVVLPGPQVVAAAVGGPLVSLDAGPSATGATWRFHAANNVGGALDASPDGRRLLLGAANKTVYSLDEAGMLLWAHRADDAITGIAADPSGGAVFVSEDSAAVAVDMQGQERWRVATGGPVTARPGLGEGRVVVAGEDGSIRVVDADTGRTTGRIDLGDAITADVAVDGDVAIVASREGRVAAIDLATAGVRWRASASGGVAKAPVIDGDRVLVVADGRYHAFAMADGSTSARSTSSRYTGAPAATSSGVLVPRQDGGIDLLDSTGAVVTSWEAMTSGSAFADGFVLADGAAWGLDGTGRIFRLGPPRAGDAAPLTPRWTLDLSHPALLLGGAVPDYPPVPTATGEALLLDFGGGVQMLDPVSARLRFLGRVEGVEDPAGGGVVHDGVLVVGTRQSLHAVTFPELRPLWVRNGLGSTAGPPLVNGDTVYWASSGAGSGGTSAPARLHAVSLRTGELLWESPAAESIVAAGVAVAGDVVVAGHEPAAYDARSGRRIWSLDDRGAGLGAPAVSPDGASVAVGMVDVEGPGGPTLTIVETATGRIRQTTPLPRGAFIDATDGIRWDDTGIVVPQLDGGVAAFDAGGLPRWEFVPPVQRFGDLGHTADAVWLELVDGRVLVIDARSGDVVARDVAADELHDVNSATSKPVQVGDVVVLPNGRTIRGYPSGTP